LFGSSLRIVWDTIWDIPCICKATSGVIYLLKENLQFKAAASATVIVFSRSWCFCHYPLASFTPLDKCA
jgi:hypothetical protein